MRGIPYTKKQIQIIRDEVRRGKSRYRVAKEMGLSDHAVWMHTKDLPCRYPGDPCISGKSFELLRQLLDTGVVPCTNENRARMRTLRKHLPMIQYSRLSKKGIYYLNEKNKLALQTLLETKRSRIIDYQELSQMLNVFNVKADYDEKKAFLGEKPWREPRKIRESIVRYRSNLKEKQAKIDDFLGRFWHSEVLTVSETLFLIW